jgi:hypothetical protein
LFPDHQAIEKAMDEYAEAGALPFMETYGFSWKNVEHYVVRDQGYLDTVPEVKNWRATNGGVFIAKEMDENWLAERVHNAFLEMQFMITPLQIETVQGYQDAETWDFIRKSEASLATLPPRLRRALPLRN